MVKKILIECGRWGWVRPGTVMGVNGDNCNCTTIKKGENIKILKMNCIKTYRSLTLNILFVTIQKSIHSDMILPEYGRKFFPTLIKDIIRKILRITSIKYCPTLTIDIEITRGKS